MTLKTDTERALQKGERALLKADARKEKAAQSLGRLLEDEETARRAAHLFKQMLADRD